MITSTTTQQNMRHGADSVVNSAEKAIDSTRDYANHALDVADEKIHNLGSSVKPVLDKLSRKAEEYAYQGMDMAMHAKDRARESMSHYGTVTSRYVSDKPVQSVLIAAAVGATVALLVFAARNRNRY